MNDLISRRGLIKHFEAIQQQENVVGLVFVAAIDEIKEQPTAYDVDKVISQLGDYGNEEIEYYRNTPYENCIRECVSKAIEIVKQGGVSDASDNVCEWIKYDYRTICPKNHDANNPYWKIPDNTDKLKYCPYCGKKIKVVGD